MFTGSNKRTEFRRVRDDSDRHVHKSRAVPESREQSITGEYKTSSTRNPSLATQQTLQHEGDHWESGDMGLRLPHGLLL